MVDVLGDYRDLSDELQILYSFRKLDGPRPLSGLARQGFTTQFVPSQLDSHFFHTSTQPHILPKKRSETPRMFFGAIPLTVYSVVIRIQQHDDRQTKSQDAATPSNTPSSDVGENSAAWS